MTKDELIQLATALMEADGGNIVPEKAALSPSVAGFPLYDAPILAFGSANDPLFETLKKPEAAGELFLEPKAWLPTAETVVSLFFPFSQQVRTENKTRRDWPGYGWIHARAEGMDMIDRVNAGLCAHLEACGYQAVNPTKLPMYRAVEDAETARYTSNWSLRHVGYVCGLGTFGLSGGLITKKGVAGRLSSLITNYPFAPDVREYTGLHDYCSFCGACANFCPSKAISLHDGKNQALCAAFLDEVTAKTPQRPGAHNLRYGCGKCQVRVPCESRAMVRRTRRKKEAT